MCQHAWHMEKAIYGVWELLVEVGGSKKENGGGKKRKRKEREKEKKRREKEGEKESGVLMVKTHKTKK